MWHQSDSLPTKCQCEKQDNSIKKKKKKSADQRSHDIAQQNSSLFCSGLYMTSATYLAYVGQCLNIVKVKKSIVIQLLLML